MLQTRIYRWPFGACFWLAASYVLAGPAEDQYSVAAGHYAASRWQLASEEFEAFLADFPQHPTADLVRFFYGESLVQQGRYDEAGRQFATFLENQPAHKHAAQAQFRVGEAAYLAGDSQSAQRAFEEFRRRYPESNLHQFVQPYLGDLALARGDAAEARSRYGEALAQHPQSPLRDACRLGMGRALESLGDTNGAERYYRDLAYEPQKALADDAQLRLGLLLYRTHAYERAAHELRRLETAFPQSEHTLQAQYWQAKSQLALQNWEGAAATLAAIRVAPDHELAPGVAFAQGEALARLRRTTEAHRRLREVVALWPESEWADDALQTRIDLAVATGDAETIDALAVDFQNRFADSPLLASVRLAHGRSLLHRAKHAEAGEIFEKLLQAAAPPAEAKPAVREEVCRYYLGLARLGAGQHEAALAAMQPIALEHVAPELAEGVRVALAAALVGLDRFEEAAPLFREYLKSQPTGPDAPKCRAQLVVALAKIGRLTEATEAHEEFAQRNADHPHFLPATEFLAEAAYAAGEREIAKRAFTLLARDGNPERYAAKGLSGLAWLEFEGNDPAQSAAVFERLLREHPDSKLAAEAAMMQARALERLEQFDPAAEMYQLVLDKHGTSAAAPAAMMGLARLHDRQGHDSEAASLYERLVNEHPQAPDLDAALYQWAWALVDLNQADAADEVFARLVNDYRQSQFWCDAAYRLAERAAHRQDMERAKQLVQRILDAQPQGDVLAHSLYLQGQVAAVEERWSDVAPPMERILAEFPQSSLRLSAMYWTAESHYQQRRYDEAGRRLAELASLAEQAHGEWLAMIPLRQAQVLAHQKQWREAQEIASAIAVRFPDFRQQYEVDYLLGRCLMAQARFSDARAAFDRVIHSITGGRTETAAMAQWMIGETYFHQKNFLEAIKAYHRVERLFPFPRWQAGALLQSGKCHEQRGEFRDAVQLYAQVLKDFPDSPFTEEASQRLRVAQKRATLSAAP